MSICPHPCPSGPTGSPGRRLGSGLGRSPSIPVRSKRLQLASSGGALHLGGFIESVSFSSPTRLRVVRRTAATCRLPGPERRRRECRSKPSSSRSQSAPDSSSRPSCSTLDDRASATPLLADRSSRASRRHRSCERRASAPKMSLPASSRGSRAASRVRCRSEAEQSAHNRRAGGSNPPDPRRQIQSTPPMGGVLCVTSLLLSR